MPKASGCDPCWTNCSIRSIIRHSTPNVVEGTVVPLLAFTLLVHTLGIGAALWGSLAWAFGASARRAVTGRRISGILMLGLLGLTVRVVTMAWTGSTFVFFAQPIVSTLATAAAFAISAAFGRPLTARLGADFVPLPAEAWRDPEVLRLSVRLAFVWAAALTANAGLTLWMLWRLSLPTFVLLKPTVGIVTTLPAIVVSVLSGRVLVRRVNGARRGLVVEPDSSRPRAEGFGTQAQRNRGPLLAAVTATAVS